MNYSETLQWMFQQLPMYQKQGKTAFKKDLTNSLALSKHLGQPQEKFKSIHVGGTNGKGSVSHILAAILQANNYKVGLYTSPHLKDFRERIKVNGKEVSQDFVVNFIADNKLFLEKQKLSFFEMSVGMAFDYFAQQKVDIAIIEVGLGGRLDSTNIIQPILSIITNIGLDHIQFLGDSLQKIAVEKAGIIKENTPVIIGETQKETKDVFEETAKNRQASIIFADKENEKTYTSDLKGNYQQKNIQTAVAAVKVLKDLGWKLAEIKTLAALKQVKQLTGFKGRWHILQKAPKIIADTAHNAEGLQYVLRQLQEEEFEQLHLVFGVVNDKNLDTILPMLPKKGLYYFCCPNIPRGKPVKELQAEAAKANLKGDVFNTVSEALNEARANADKKDLIFVGGSTFTVAEII